jgi:hypothetical protein
MSAAGAQTECNGSTVAETAAAVTVDSFGGMMG